MNTIVGLIVGLASAAVGAVVAYWLQKSRPWLGIVSVFRDDHQLVPVSDELRALVMASHWLEKLDQSEVPLRKVLGTGLAIEKTLPRLKSALQTAEDLEAKLRGPNTTAQEFRKSLVAFLTDEAALGTLLGMFRRQELPIPEETQLALTQQPILQAEDFTGESVEDKVFVLDVDSARVLIRPGSKYAGQTALARTRALGRILQYGMQNQMLPIVSAVRGEIQGDFKCLLEIKERLQDIIHARRLIIRAQITNTGGSPEHLEPFGVLKIHTTGRPVEPILVSVQKAETYEPGADAIPSMMAILEGLAAKQEIQVPASTADRDQGPQYVVVKPGDVVACELCTIDPIENPEVVAALQNGMLSCQLIMRRAGRSVLRWLASDRQVLGFSINQQKREELLAKAK